MKAAKLQHIKHHIIPLRRLKSLKICNGQEKVEGLCPHFNWFNDLSDSMKCLLQRSDTVVLLRKDIVMQFVCWEISSSSYNNDDEDKSGLSFLTGCGVNDFFII